MKIISVLIIGLMLAGSALAQDAKVLAEIAASSERVVRNAPFTAEAVSESIQTLADGNRIVRRSTSKLYRNGEGRFRRELSDSSGGVLGSTYTIGPGITILDPVGGFRYQLDPTLKTARQAIVRTSPGTYSAATPLAEKNLAVIAERQKAELKAQGQASAAASVATTLPNGVTVVSPAAAPNVSVWTSTGTIPTGIYAGAGRSIVLSPSIGSKYDSKTEQLGTQTIEGVSATGTRTVTTIPAGAIGNERPIETVYERWYSADLQLVVLSKTSDPRFGEQTYRLTNIDRTEPDPSLFALPQGYRLVTEPGGVYKVSTGSRVDVEKAAKGMTVVTTRP